MPFVSSREVEEFTSVIKDLLSQADELEKVVTNLKNENADLKNKVDFLNNKIKDLMSKNLQLEEELMFEKRENSKLMTKLFELK